MGEDDFSVEDGETSVDDDAMAELLDDDDMFTTKLEDVMREGLEDEVTGYDGTTSVHIPRRKLPDDERV